MVLKFGPAAVCSATFDAEQGEGAGLIQGQLRGHPRASEPAARRQDHLLQLSHARTRPVLPLLPRISTINKLVRVVKLNIIGLLPLIVHTQLVVVVVVALCQAISLCAFFLKFTYQKCIYEYVLLVCVFFGFISAVANVF